MFLISLFVIVPIAYVLSGRELPVVVRDLLNDHIPNDTAPSKDLVAWAMLAGAAVGATPIHKLIRYISTLVHELGHAFTAGILGGRPKHITISTDASGLAMYQPPVHWGEFARQSCQPQGIRRLQLHRSQPLKLFRWGTPRRGSSFPAALSPWRLSR